MQSSCLTVVLRRAGEIAAWCAHRGRHDDPAQSLRTQALRPSHLLTTPLERRLEAARRRRDYTQHEFLHVGAERDAIIDVVSRKRAEFLRAEGHYPSEMSCDLAGGRLLMSEDSSVWDGASQAESKGFFDEDDRPPWDTWLCYVQGADYPIAAVPPKATPRSSPHGRYGIWCPGRRQRCLIWLSPACPLTLSIVSNGRTTLISPSRASFAQRECSRHLHDPRGPRRKCRRHMRSWGRLTRLSMGW